MSSRSGRGFPRVDRRSLRFSPSGRRWWITAVLLSGVVAFLQLPALASSSAQAGASLPAISIPSFGFGFGGITTNSQTITFLSTPPSGALVGGTYVLSAIGGASGNPVTFSIDASSSSGACSINGSTVTFNADGTCVIDANQAGNASYTAAAQAQQSVVIGPAIGSTNRSPLLSQSITIWTTPPANPLVGGTYTLGAIGGGSGSPVVVSIDRRSNGSCMLSGGTTDFVTAGLCVMDVNEAGRGMFAPAPQVQQSVTVKTLVQPQAITFTSTAPSGATVGSTYKVTATGGGSGKPVTFSIDGSSTSGACSLSGSTVSFKAAGTCVVDANQAGNASFSAAPQVQQSFMIGAATVVLTAQAITFTSTAPSGATVGGTYTATATGGGSGKPVTFSIDSSSTSGACSLSGSTVSFNAAGTCVVDANQASSASYSAAPQVQQSFMISAADPPSNPPSDPPSNPPSDPPTSGGAASPSSPVCGNASILSGPATAPAGAVTLPAGDNSSMTASYQLAANTTYWFAPGTHTIGSSQFAQFQPDQGDTFIGAPGAILSGQGENDYAFVSDATGVTVEYLTIEDFVAPESEGVVNQNSATGWTIENNTIEDNPDGAGAMLGTNDVLTNNCLTENGQYGFQSYAAGAGPSNVTVTDNEISYNDTANYEASDPGCGCTGGAKFWLTTGATVTGNYVHDNESVGLWADTDNSGFDISDNYISNNYGEGIIYEISYNALISGNTFVKNGLGSGPSNPGFPTPAIYISESGGDSRVPGPYSGSLTISGNTFTDNYSGVILWENANRYCGSTANTSTGTCTLVAPSIYTPASCSANVPNSTPSGNPDYFDNCRWKTQNVSVTDNTFNLNPADIGSGCTPANGCGFNGLFSEYGTYAPFTGWVVPNNISNHQNDHFSDNTYNGPWSFMGFAQGEIVTWAQWTAGFADTNGSGDTFAAQDAGSTYSS
jgi:hypothetical protein